MPLQREPDAEGALLVLVPGVGIQPDDFNTKGLIRELARRRLGVTVATVDPGVESYMDGSVEDRLLDGIATARQTAGASRIWLAGISLGCQGILRCVRVSPAVAEGVMLIAPYIASTGLIAEAAAAGGLRSWAGLASDRVEPERSLLRWLATTPPAGMLVGWARQDRFAATGSLLADLIPVDRVVRVDGQHDWSSWLSLWRLMLDKDPFGQEHGVS